MPLDPEKVAQFQRGLSGRDLDDEQKRALLAAKAQQALPPDQNGDVIPSKNKAEDVANLWGFEPKVMRPEAQGAQVQQKSSDPMQVAYQLVMSGEADTPEEAMIMARKRLGLDK